MDNTVLTVIVAVIGSGALTATVNIIAGRRKRSDGVRDGIKAILYDRIKFLGRKYLEAGEITSEDLEDLITMHGIYHGELGGNGYLDSLMSQVRLLRIKP